MPTRYPLPWLILVLSCGAQVGADGGIALVVESFDAGPGDAGRPVRPLDGGVTCQGSGSCSTPPADVCAVLPDLKVGEPFRVAYDTLSSGWGSRGDLTATMVRGVPRTVSNYFTDGKDKGVNSTLAYDGECAVWSVSSYCCNTTDNRNVATTVSAFSYGN